jgi:hypothetical protein
MKSKTSSIALRVLILLAAFTSLSAISHAQGGGSKVPCAVEITSIKDGDKVGPSVTVRGKGKIPTDGNLWILVRKRAMGNQWWPQAGGPVEIDKNEEWEAEVFFGRSEDVASNFDVVGIVVSHQTSAEFIKWFSTAKALDYPPVPFPDVNSFCQVVRIKVTRVR